MRTFAGHAVPGFVHDSVQQLQGLVTVEAQLFSKFLELPSFGLVDDTVFQKCLGIVIVLLLAISDVLGEA